MGKEKHLKEILDLFEKSPVVEFSSAERIVKKKKNIKQYTKQLIRNLILKGRIKRLTKSFYTLHGDPSLAVFCFKPSYLGLQDALSFHNLWEQETIPVIITVRKARPGIRKILGMNVLIKRLNKRYLFGFDYYEYKNFYLPYSDIEKTLIDLIYFKERLNKEMVKNIVKRIDIKKLNSYLKSYPRQIKDRVMKTIKK